MPDVLVRPSPPAFFHVPDGAVFTIADEIADLMQAVGYEVEEPERLACHALFPQRADGDWIGLESAIVCARQNLKTVVQIGGALHDTFVQGVERVVWTAHEFKTSSDAFRDLRAIIEGNSWLDSEVLKVRTANGKEGFELRNGSRLDILARTGRSGRGMAAPRLYADEALYLEGKMMGALVPTMSARPNAHIVYGSSPGILTSGVLRGLRKRGRSGTDPRLGYIEWTSERGPCEDPECLHGIDAAGCLLDDEERWWSANPALDRRISRDFVRQERRALASDPAEFMRERLGWWEDPPTEDGDDPLFPGWEETLDPESVPEEGTSIAWSVDVSWNRQVAYVAAAGRRSDGVPHAQVVHRCEPSQVVDWLATRMRKRPSIGVAVQGSGAPASSLLEHLRKAINDPGAEETVIAMSGADVAKACGDAYDAIRSGGMRHPADPLLDVSVSKAVGRPLGDGWAIDRKKSPIDVANLVAVVNALYLLATSPDESGDPGVWFL